MKEYTYEIWAYSELILPHFRSQKAIMAENVVEVMKMAEANLPEKRELARWQIRNLKSV